MKINRLEVIGLLNRPEPVDLRFHGDLNIITGKNGVGKTSVLKLLWYVVSGNILLALTEVPFKRLTLETDSYTCVIYRLSSNTCRIEMTTAEGAYVFEDEDVDEDFLDMISAEDGANKKVVEYGSSVFFPTFRRIEGGFSLKSNRTSGIIGKAMKAKSEVEEALISLSRRLTNSPHVFVSSISTGDIVELLLRQHSDLSETYNDFQKETSQTIIQNIRDFKQSGEDASLSNANVILNNIRRTIEDMENRRDEIMAPFSAVKQVVERLFSHIAIKIGNRISFGEAANAVNSDLLSAGEKQMLSFICYNAFYKNSIIFIDEPELSLHVDWQRQLFPMLQKQQSSNQFIIATHSPFIYSKYPDREVCLDSDRGDEEGNLA
jgi:predicted ATPase